MPTNLPANWWVYSNRATRMIPTGKTLISSASRWERIDRQELGMKAASLHAGNYSINIRVADDENASFDKNFTIQAIHDPNKDDDNDGLTYSQEQAFGTSDNNPDTDGDGFYDGMEFAANVDPTGFKPVPNLLNFGMVGWWKFDESNGPTGKKMELPALKHPFIILMMELEPRTM